MKYGDRKGRLEFGKGFNVECLYYGMKFCSSKLTILLLSKRPWLTVVKGIPKFINAESATKPLPGEAGAQRSKA
jgi:hypothetical protein